MVSPHTITVSVMRYIGSRIPTMALKPGDKIVSVWLADDCHGSSVHVLLHIYTVKIKR